jgi:hypothetical protein
MAYPGEPPDAAAYAMGSIHMAHREGASAVEDPAALARLQEPCFHLQASDPFGIPELAYEALALCLPAAKGGFGLLLGSTGTSGYRTWTGSLSYGKSFGRFRAGIRLGPRLVSQGYGYGFAFAVIPGLSLQVTPLKGVILGLAVDNPARQEYRPRGAGSLPRIFRIGAGIDLAKDGWACLELEKESNRRVTVKLGFEGTVNSRVFLRIGVTTDREVPLTFGAGFLQGRYALDLAAAYHPELGFTPALTLSWKTRPHPSK